MSKQQQWTPAEVRHAAEEICIIIILWSVLVFVSSLLLH